MTPDAPRPNRSLYRSTPEPFAPDESLVPGADAMAPLAPRIGFRAGGARAWMTPVSEVLPDAPPHEVPGAPNNDATEIQKPLDLVAGQFTVGPDFYLRDVLPGPTIPFAHKPHCGVSIWAQVNDPVRRALYGVFKRLLTQEDQVVVECALPNHTRLRFTSTRHTEEIITCWEVLADEPTVPDAPPAHVASPTLPPSLLQPVPTPVPLAMDPLPTPALRPAIPDGVGDDLFQSAPDIICVLDEAGRILGVNPAGQAALGFDKSQVPGLPLLALVAPEEHDLVRRTWKALGGTPQPLLCRCYGADGSLCWVQWNLGVSTAKSATDQTRVYAVGRDVTEHRVREDSLRWHLYHDTLTGLPNRSMLQDRLQYALVSAHRYHHQVAVLFLDLDRFKRINDTLGHASGDLLLREVAGRLQIGLREEDTVARLAGDEFVIVLPRINDFADALKVAEKVLAHIGQPLFLSGQELYITGSIGISLYPQDGTSSDLLLKAADTAMYRAKAGGPGRFSIADASVDAGLGVGRLTGQPLERLRLENKLSQAIERDELLLHYQPQISLTTNQVVGAEALMRWNSGEMGAIPPSTFIPLAEETGLIVRMGAWAMHQAIVQAGHWRRAGNPVQIAVNLSAAQLGDRRFPDMLETYLHEWQIPATLLSLELTERTFIHAETATLDVLTRLKSLGVGLSVDDFGTGYGTFSYLRQFPIDGLKVDRSFVAQVDTNPADEAVVRSIIDLAHTLNLTVIAEGVETEAQRDKLVALGCNTMQGHLFSRAVAPADFGPLLVPGGKL